MQNSACWMVDYKTLICLQLYCVCDERAVDQNESYKGGKLVLGARVQKQFQRTYRFKFLSISKRYREVSCQFVLCISYIKRSIV
jgi:hypothetical protein